MREVPEGALAHAVPSDQRSPEGTDPGGSRGHALKFTTHLLYVFYFFELALNKNAFSSFVRLS